MNAAEIETVAADPDADRVAGETLVTLIELAREFRSPRTGNTLHIASVRRWVRRGIAGVRLGVVHVGGTVYTSREEFDRWRRAVARERSRRQRSEKVRGGRTSQARERARLRAKAENDRRRDCKRKTGATR